MFCTLKMLFYENLHTKFCLTLAVDSGLDLTNTLKDIPDSALLCVVAHKRRNELAVGNSPSLQNLTLARNRQTRLISHSSKLSKVLVCQTLVDLSCGRLLSDPVLLIYEQVNIHS